jgi:hypothetical protein
MFLKKKEPKMANINSIKKSSPKTLRSEGSEKMIVSISADRPLFLPMRRNILDTLRTRITRPICGPILKKLRSPASRRLITKSNKLEKTTMKSKMFHEFLKNDLP